MKVKIPQLKNLPLKVCASLISFSLTAPTLLDNTFKVIFFDLYVAMASLMASIEPSTSPKWPRKNNALHQNTCNVQNIMTL